MSRTLLEPTLGNPAWMAEHRDDLRQLFPETWTLGANLNLMAIGFKLKLLGVEWRSMDELSRILAFLTKYGVVIVGENGTQFRRSAR